MKKIIITLLSKGYSKTKKYKVKDLPFFLRELFEDTDNGIKANNNKFWEKENQKNRSELITDMFGFTGKIGTGTTYRVYNRVANGDKYGIIESKVEGV